MRFPRCRRGLTCEGLEQRRLLSVSRLAFDDFERPRVLDFEAAELGPVSETAAWLKDFGVARISATGRTAADTFNDRPNASRALWSDAEGLRIVDPGETGLLRDGLTYRIEFTDPQFRVGVGVHDEPGVYVLQLWSGGEEVGSFAFSSGGDLAQGVLQSTESFDAVIVHYTSREVDQGFALDNITLEGPLNQPPLAVDDFVDLVEDSGPVEFDVTLNDSDPEGTLAEARVMVTVLPSHGVLEDLGAGRFRYTPMADFHGRDRIVYQLCDAGGLCDDAQVTLEVESVVDATLLIESDRYNLRSSRPLDLAILSTQTASGEDDDLDATAIDVTSLTLNGARVSPRELTFADIDHDGDLDLLLRFSLRDLTSLGVFDGSSAGGAIELSGESLEGQALTGFGAVGLVPAHRDPDHAGQGRSPSYLSGNGNTHRKGL